MNQQYQNAISITVNIWLPSTAYPRSIESTDSIILV